MIYFLTKVVQIFENLLVYFVIRLGFARDALVIYFLTKVVEIFGNLLAYCGNITFQEHLSALATFGYHFVKYWATLFPTSGHTD